LWWQVASCTFGFGVGFGIAAPYVLLYLLWGKQKTTAIENGKQTKNIRRKKPEKVPSVNLHDEI